MKIKNIHPIDKFNKNKISLGKNSQKGTTNADTHKGNTI